MGGVVIIILVFLALLAVFGVVGFMMWRNILRFAKGVERGLKMVPILIHLPPPSDDIEVGTRDKRDVIQEQISQAEVLYNLVAATLTKGIKTKFYGQRHFGFEIISFEGLIKFYISVPVALESVVRQAVLTSYPTANLEDVEESNIFNPGGKISGTIGGEITLKESYSYPIATFTQLKRSAVEAMITALSSLQAQDGAGIQILMRPAHSGWTKNSENLVSKKRKGKGGKNGLSVRTVLEAPFKVPEQKEQKPEEKQLTTMEQSTLDAIEEKTKHPGFEVLIRVIASAPNSTRSQAILHSLVAAFALFDAPGSNGFKFEPAKDIENFVTAYIFRFFPPEVNNMILNSVELATLFHLPDDQFTPSEQVVRQFSKQVEGPSKLPEHGLLLGQNVYRGVKKDIRLTVEDRRRHTYIIGQTGTGKSTILKQLIVQDMLAGNGFAFIDPHGDAAEDIMTMVPKNRVEDVIYFNPGSMDYPLGLNIFEYDNDDDKDFLIQECINMLYRLYDPGHTGIIGPIYEHWFRNAALLVMADPNGGTFIDIPKLFLDKAYMREKLKHVTDPTVIDFWTREMVQGAGGRQGEVMQWFVSKFGAFASNTMMRNIIGQTKSSFDLRQVMDEGKILIANLSKGKLGELNSQLLGVFFVMKFQAAAMGRANMPENERRDFCLYVDEFQNFSTDSFADILSEARKYRLNLIVANQFIEQLSEEIRDAVFGNVGSIISFRCGPNDADFLTKQFAPSFDARDLVNLPNLTAAVRLMIRGVPTQPFSMQLLPPLNVINPQLGVALKQLSAAKYGRGRAQVEADIFKRLESKPAPSPFNAFGQPSSGTAINQPPSMPRTPGASSFLDEWLAKRGRSQTAVQPSRPEQISKNNQPIATPAGPASNAQEQHDTDDAASKIHSVHSASKAPEPAKAPNRPQINLDNPSDTELVDPDASAARAQSAQPKPGDQSVLSSKIDNLQSSTQDKAALDKVEKKEAPKQPRPGEIFIDEAGNLHNLGQEIKKQ